MKRVVLKIFLTLLIVCFLQPFVAAQDVETQDTLSDVTSETKDIVSVTEEFATSHEGLIKDKTFQFDYAPPRVNKPKKPRSSFSRSFDSFALVVGPIMKLIFWAFLIFVVGTILWFILKEAIRIQRGHVPKIKKSKDAPLPAYTPDASVANALLMDVDTLAAQGRFEEAVHTLLLRSIDDIKSANPRSVPRDLTSREISTLQILSELARNAFNIIGQRVERSYFGGRSLTKEDFDISREAYTEFAFETNPRRRRR